MRHLASRYIAVRGLVYKTPTMYQLQTCSGRLILTYHRLPVFLQFPSMLGFSSLLCGSVPTHRAQCVRLRAASPRSTTLRCCVVTGLRFLSCFTTSSTSPHRTARTDTTHLYADDTQIYGFWRPVDAAGALSSRLVDCVSAVDAQ
jgi:hypothetical protein